MWAQSTELKGAVGSGEVGEDRAQGVFPMAARGKDNGTELSREKMCWVRRLEVLVQVGEN